MFLLRFPTCPPKSSRSSPTLNGASTPSSLELANKMQVLAWQSPKHLKVVEAFVDQILKRLDVR